MRMMLLPSSRGSACWPVAPCMRWWTVVVFAAGGLALSSCETRIRPPVVVGQTSVDASRLPFACITIATTGRWVPVENIVVENLDTQATTVCTLGEGYNRSPQYPLEENEGGRALSLAILQLVPGHYRLKSVHVSPLFATMTLPAPAGPDYQFVVAPGRLNFVGTVVYSADWRKALILAPTVKDFDCRMSLERTAEHDRLWATARIPALAALPYCESPFEGTLKFGHL
jgi:hypothetical protein